MTNNKPLFLCMRTSVLGALLLIVAAATPAAASAISRFECGAARAVPSEPDDSDPVFKTEIMIWFSPASAKHPTGFEVKHHTASGQVYQRDLQYRDIRRESTRGGDRWSGVSMQNQRLTMTGTLFEERVRGQAQARYVERLYRDGKLQRTVTSVCRVDETDIAEVADNRLPLPFVGVWCIGSQEPAYYRGECPDRSDGWLKLRTDGYDAHEMGCKVLKAVPNARGDYLVKFRCSGEGSTWTENYWLSLVDQRLFMNKTDREP
jgi:hypothetical protein